MMRFITGLILGGIITASGIILLGFGKPEIGVSSKNLPAAPISQEDRYFIEEQVSHLVIGEREGAPTYGFEIESRTPEYKGVGTISSGGDWNPTDDWWIYSDDGRWFWIYDGATNLRLEKVGLEGIGIYDPCRRQLPEAVHDRLPSDVRERYRNSRSEQAGTGQPATRSETDSEGGDKPQPESEGRSR